MKKAKMHRISQLSAMRKATRWNRVGIKWHFHLLSPNCLLNSNGMHLLVLESPGGVFLSAAKQRHLDVGHRLVKLLHGAKILAYSPSHSQGKVSKILARAKHLMKKRIHWHHHLLFPQCIYSEHSGKWTILFEDPLNNSLTEIIYPHFPGKDLAEVEKLFYSQRK